MTPSNSTDRHPSWDVDSWDVDLSADSMEVQANCEPDGPAWGRLVLPVPSEDVDVTVRVESGHTFGRCYVVLADANQTRALADALQRAADRMDAHNEHIDTADTEADA